MRKGGLRRATRQYHIIKVRPRRDPVQHVNTILSRSDPEEVRRSDPEVGPVAHFRSATKAPEDWRTPRPGGLPGTLELAKRLGLR